MPRVDPASSFEVSARHLFRHVNDLDALRTNPLVRSYFGANAVGNGGLLKAIHAHILALSETHCDELSAKGLQLRAQRRRAIVSALCAGEAPAETAAGMRISRSQYYRERNAICSEVARGLKRASPAQDARFAVGGDPVRLLFKRAEVLRDAGFSLKAVSLLEEAHRCIADEFAKSTVSLGLAEELVFLGSHDQARELLARSRDLPSREFDDADEWLRETWTLCGARLESQLSRNAGGADALETLAKRRIAERRSDDITYDAIFLTGEGYRNAGRFAEARAMLRRLQAMDARYLHAVPKRQIGVLLLAAYCAENSSDELGLAEQSLRDALDLSVASGTLVGALLAMAGTIAHDAQSGRGGAAYTMANEALRVARGADFNGFLGYVLVGIAGSLMQTHYWRAVSPLLFDLEELTAPRALGRALLRHAQASYFMRTGRRNRAREALIEGVTLARALGNRRIEGLMLRDRALTLWAANAGSEQAELMREAVDLVERFGTSGDLAATYGAAARVLGDRRSLRLARQVSRPVVAHDEPAPPSVEPLRLRVPQAVSDIG